MLKFINMISFNLTAQWGKFYNYFSLKDAKFQEVKEYM